MKILKNGNALLNYDRVSENKFEVTNITKKETSRQCFENKPRLENGVKAEA